MKLQKRILGQYTEQNQGPLFICLGGIHGNEHAGLLAFQRVFAHLQKNTPEFNGELVGVAGNLPAIEQKIRFVELDLNRQWYDEKIKSIEAVPKNQLKNEDKEQRELLSLLKRLLNQTPYSPVVLLDMHTTSAKGGIPFAIANDTPLSQELALNLGVPTIMGVEKIVRGTTLNYFSQLTLSAFGFEAGQHDNPLSVDRMEAAIWLTLHKIGCMRYNDVPNYDAHRALLEKLGQGIPKLVEFSYRHAISEQDEFVMRPGYKNFQPVKKGEVLAHDVRGEVKSDYNGMVLMPLYQKQGEDGFFIIQEVEMPTLA